MVLGIKDTQYAPGNTDTAEGLKLVCVVRMTNIYEFESHLGPKLGGLEI